MPPPLLKELENLPEKKKSLRESRVLVLEDDPGWQERWEEELELPNLSVVATNEEAISIIRKGGLEVAVLDLMLGKKIENNSLPTISAAVEAGVPVIILATAEIQGNSLVSEALGISSSLCFAKKREAFVRFLPS